MPVKNGFNKGDLVITEMGFPAFVYERQMAKGYISIFAFGWEAEHGSEYPEKARKVVDKEEWFKLCESNGHSRDFVLETAKKFKVNI